MTSNNYKIAIVHDFTVRYGGAEALVKALMDEFPEAPLFTLFYDKDKMERFFPADRVKTSYLQKFYQLTKKYTWLLPFMPMAIESFDLSKYDVIISSSAAFSHGVLTTPEQKHISYIHSPMRWAWDWHFAFMAERNMGELKKFLFTSVINKIRQWDKTTASHPDVLLSASSIIKDRIKKYWRQDSVIVHPFADLDRFTINNNIESKDYFLVVAQLVPYKRIDIVIKACEELNLPLKIVGDGIMKETLMKLAGKNTQFLGAKYGDELVAIMQGAKAFIFPGVDDFGITPVEAMACGVPVVAYAQGGILDSLQEDVSGVFFKEQNVDSLKQALKTTNWQQFSAKNIRDSVLHFSKTNFINQIKKNIYS